MENYIQKAEKNFATKIIFGIAMFLIVFNTGFAQEATDITVSATNQEEEGLTQTEIISYIAMVLGFSVLIIFAWWTTAKAKKRSAEEAHHAIAAYPKTHAFHHTHPNDPYKRQKSRGRKYH